MFITAVPITKLFAWGEGEWRTCATRDDEPRPVGTREELGTLTQGAAAYFPWFLSFGNRTQNSRVAGARPTTSPWGSGAHPGRGWNPWVQRKHAKNRHFFGVVTLDNNKKKKKGKEGRKEGRKGKQREKKKRGERGGGGGSNSGQ